ncbi:MAG: pseudouridine synthase [Bacilli bacterium]|nr:pseudouridine synthase [Bacilli bacterium]MDD4584538.1 pseudouridine synthase [Bacilli bacterium]
MERLQKIIANSGFCSRRKAESLIVEGKVKVNDEIVTKLGTTVDENAIIEVDGKKINFEEKVYYILNKPRNCVSTVKDDRGRPTVMDCIRNVDKRVYPIGRLDFDTTGVLLFTNDGDLTNKLTHPKNEVDKVYIASIAGKVDESRLESLRKGVNIEGYKTSEAVVDFVKYNDKQNRSIISLKIHEGRNRQIKKMFEAIGYEVIKLNRESFGGITANGLKEGQFRKLTSDEITYLKKL